MEITKAYLAKQVDEITLQQADVVLILEQEDGEHRVMGLGGLGGVDGPGGVHGVGEMGLGRSGAHV